MQAAVCNCPRCASSVKLHMRVCRLLGSPQQKPSLYAGRYGWHDAREDVVHTAGGRQSRGSRSRGKGNDFNGCEHSLVGVQSLRTACYLLQLHGANQACRYCQIR